jgi:hypothetical protein
MLNLNDAVPHPTIYTIDNTIEQFQPSCSRQSVNRHFHRTVIRLSQLMVAGSVPSGTRRSCSVVPGYAIYFLRKTRENKDSGSTPCSAI